MLSHGTSQIFLMSRLNRRMNHPISFHPGKEKRKERVSEMAFDGNQKKPLCWSPRAEARWTRGAFGGWSQG